MATFGIESRRITLAVAWTAFLWLAPDKGLAQQQDIEKEVAEAGRPAYEQYCAVCHGRTGKGDGPAVNLLTVKPADLTQLSKKNNDMYPFWRVYAIIDGREEVKGHGTSDMPIWGQEFRLQAGTSALAQSEVRGRVLELVHYLESIQEK